MSKTYSPGSPRSRSRWVSERSLCSRNPIGGSTEFRVRADTQILRLHLTYAGAVVGRALGFNVQTYLSLRSLLNSVHKYEIVYVIGSSTRTIYFVCEQGESLPCACVPSRPASAALSMTRKLHRAFWRDMRKNTRRRVVVEKVRACCGPIASKSLPTCLAFLAMDGTSPLLLRLVLISKVSSPVTRPP